jgi:hypothetical protein
MKNWKEWLSPPRLFPAVLLVGIVVYAWLRAPTG